MSPSDDYTSAIFMFGGNYAPPDYAFCDGAIVHISNFPGLYAVISDAYGGDGRSTFGLPDYRSRVPIGSGTAPGLEPLRVGYVRGAETTTVTLDSNNLPAHNHTASFQANALNDSVNSAIDLQSTTVTGFVECNIFNGGSVNPAGRYPGALTNNTIGVWSTYHTGATMAPDVVAGGSLSSVSITTSFNSNVIPVQIETSGANDPLTHATIPPCTVIHYLICTDGLFPPHSKTDERSAPGEAE